MKKLYQFFATILFLTPCILPIKKGYAPRFYFSTKRYSFLLLFLAVFLLNYNSNIAQTTGSNTYNGAGTYTWTCPSGVTTVTVQAWGGGGGGGGVATTANSPASGGGAGGSYTSNTVTVVAGTAYLVTVGAGGTAGANTGGNGGIGGSSTFNTTSIVAVGGSGGTGATTAVGAAGGTGTTTGNTAGTNFAGGNGAAGTVSTIGGGGGGGAGNANPGGNAVTSTAGTGGVAGGGNGANGLSNAVPGVATAPGGGGGGTRRTNTNRAGGVGGAGEVIISYANPAPTIEAFPNQTFCTAAYPTAYNTVTFSLIETTTSNFDANQTSQTLVLTLPAGFAFNTAVGTVTNNQAIAQDITIVGFSVTTTAITVTVTTAATQVNIDEINFENFQIRATAAGSGDLVRTGGTFTINGSAAIPTNLQSFGHLATSTATVYNSSAVTQYSTANIIRGCNATKNPILQFKVNITGGLCTPNDVITKFVFNTTGDAGSTNPATDISIAEVYYADTAQGFTDANFFGSVANPSGTFTITGSQALNLGNGPYYFYLTYTVPGTATVGDMLDAAMTSFTFNGTVINSMTTPSPVGGCQIVSGTCLDAGDAPSPLANIQTITAGSLIIPMDNTHQAIVAPFNLKAYGLVHALLMNDIPVKWVIKSGKLKDSSDFSANVSRVYPTATAASNIYFYASEFVVDSFWLDHSFYSGGQTATQVMTSFATPNNVAVYKLNANVSVDVRYTLNHRPKIAVFSNGGFEAVQTTMLAAAGVTNYFVQNAGDFEGLAACYTFCSEAHWEYAQNPDTRPVQNVMNFVSEGGNFLAQCAGIDLYENHQPGGGHFQTTKGVSYSAAKNNTDYNPDMAFCQYQGQVTSEAGVIAGYWPSAGSVFKPETYFGVSTPAVTDTAIASAAHLSNPDSIGSNVFYLGGHAYATGTIGNDNGIRMYLNATLVPAHRPTAFPITLPANPTICSGQTVTIGPVCASGATYIWSPATGLSNTSVCDPVASPTATTVYSVTGFNGGCIMGPSSMTVVVNPTPVMTSTNTATICGNGSVNIPLTSNLTSTYTWIATDNPNTTGESITTQTTSTLNNTIVNNTTSVQTVIYTVTPTSTLGSCAGTPQIVTVTISPAPTMTSANTATICSGAAVNIPLTANIAGSTFTWIATDNPNTTGESITTQTTTAINDVITNSTISTQNVIYTVTPTAGGCLGTAQTVTVTVNPVPSVTAAPTSQSLCSGGSASIALTSNVAGTTFTWTVSQSGTSGGTSGSGSTITQTLTATSISAGTATYTITPTAGSCPGTPITATIIVDPIPTATATPSSQNICSGNATSIALTSNVAGTTFAWTVSQSGVSGASASSGASIAQTLTATGTSPGTATYTIIPTASGCPGGNIVVTVTVNPIPSATATPTSQNICSGNATSIALTSNVAGTTFAWTVTQSGVSGASASSGASIAQTLTATGTSPGTATYTITPTAGGCAGSPIVVTVTVNPTPSATATPSSQNICSGNATSIALTSNVAGTTFAWTVSQSGVSGASASSGTNIAQTLTATGTSPGTATYTITPTAGGCPGVGIVVTVTVNPAPTATATPSSQNICSGNTTSIALTSNVVGTTFSWTVTQSGVSGASASSGTNIAQTLTATGTSPGTATYTITPSVGGCAGAAIIATVTVNPAPSATATPSSQNICSGNATSIALTSNVAGTTFAWTVSQSGVSGASANSGANIAQTLTATGTSPGTATYTITPTASGCAGTPIVVTVTVNPTPSPTATPTSQNICSGNATSMALTSSVVGTTFAWTVTQSGVSGASASSGTNIAQTLTATGTSPGTATYTITPSVGGCAGAPIIATVTVNPIPTATATPNSQTFCSGNTTSISLTSNVAGTTFAWTVTQSGVSGASASSGTNIAQTLSATGTSPGTAIYTITPTESGCTGTAITVTITVNPIPTMTSVGTATICSGGTVNIPLTSNVPSTFTWIATNNPNTTGESITTQTTSTLNNTIISTTGSTDVVVYTVTPTSSGGSCLGTAQTVSVTVSPTPIVTVTPTSQIFCSGNVTSIALTSNVAGTIFNWTVTQSGVSGASASSGSNITQTLTTSGTSSGTAIYTITPTIGTCSGSSATATVTVNPTPSATATPSSQNICSGNTTSIALTSNVLGTTFAWTVSQSGVSGASASSGTNIAQTLTATGTSPGTATYTITPTAGGCVGTSIVVTVTVNPVPSVTATPTSQAFCSGNSTSIALTSNVVGTTFAWTVSQSGVSGATNGSGANIIQTLTTTGAVPGTATYTITPTAGTCIGTTTIVTVTVNPIPSAPSASSNSPVCLTNTINLSAGTVAGATYSWTGPNTFTSNVQNPSISNAAFADAGTYSVNIIVNGCTSPSQTVIVVVNTPPPSTLTPASNSPLCTGQTLNLSIGTITSANYNWSGPNTFTSSTQNPSILNVTAAAAGIYTVVATVPGCGSSGTGTVNVVVNPTPVTPVVGSNSPICAGTTLNLTASNTGTTYSWTGPNTFTSNIQNPSVPNVVSADAGVYSVTAIALGCTSLTGTTTVVINPIPATPSVSSNSPLCVNQTLNLSTPSVGGATYSWSGPNTFTSSTQNPSISNVSTANAGTYSLAITVSGCTSADGTVAVVINATPVTPTAGSNNPVCAGDTLFLTSTSVGGATYSWTGPNSFSSTNQNPFIAPVTVAANGTYTVIANNGCASAPATVSVTVNPSPLAPTPGSNSPVCVGSTLNLTASSTGTTYNWIGPNTFTSTSQNTNITNVTSAAAGVYTVTATAAGCTSPTATISVAINSPAVVSAGGSQTVCANNDNVVLNGTSSTGSAQWSSTGTGTFAPNNTVLTATYTPSAADISAGTITLTLSSLNNGACAIVTDQMTVNITPSPTVSAGGNQSVCANNSNVTLNGTFGVASGISWTSSGSGTFSPDNLTPNATYSPSATDISAGTVTLTITSTGNGNCLAATNSMVITISPAPLVNAGADIFVCSNNPNAILNGTSSTGNAQWSSSGTGSFNPSNTTLNATYIPSAADISGGIVTLTLTSTANGNCLAVTDTTTIKYTAPPTVSAGSGVSVCGNNAAVTLNGTSSTGAGAWTTSGTGSFTPNNNTLNATYNPSAADVSAGSVTLTLASTNNGGCIAVTSQITVTITPGPTANAGANQSVCANNANVTLNGSFTVSSGGIWSSSGSGTFSPNNTNMNTTYIPSNADTAAGSVNIILTTTGNGNCNATTDTMVVTITNAPSLSAGANGNACLSNPNYTLNGTSSTGSATWTTLGSGTFNPNNATLNATYVPSTADTIAGTVTLVLTSGNNGGCNAVTDTMIIVYTNVPTVNAGSNQTVCGNNANVVLAGSSSTGTGIWSTSGTGTFTPNNTTLNGTYIPSAGDTATGNVTLTITSTNGCTPISQNILVTITDAPGVNAGTDVAVCANNPNIILNGNVSGATSTGVWSTNGTGTFNPNNATLNATYIPSNADTTAGSVNIILTSTGNGNCLAATDTMKITYTHAPQANAGSDMTVCANNAVVLNGAITGGSGNGIWTTTNGSGTFTPNATTLNAFYNTVNADTAVTNVVLVLTSTNNGGCLASTDTMLITVNPGPVVNAGADQTMCANNINISLNGTVVVATGGQWSSLGTGTFTPNNTTLNATYTPSAAEISSGTITLILASTGNGLCQAVTDTMKVHVTPAPLVNAGPDIFICNSGMIASLNGSVSGGTTTGQWTTLGSGTFAPNDSALNATYNLSTADTTAGIVKLILTSTNNASCSSVTDTVVIKLNSAPNVFAGNDTTVCGNINSIALNGFISGGIIGHWTTNGNGTFAPNDSTLNGTYSPGTIDISAGSVVLTLTSNVNGHCPSAVDSVKITFSQGTVVNAGTNISICNGVMIASLNGTISGGTTTGQWTTLGSGTFTPNDSTLNATYNLSSADTTAGTVKLVLTSTHNGSCSVVTDTVLVSINPVTITKAGNDTTVCSGVSSIQLNGSVNGSSPTGIWSTAGTGTFTPNNTTLNASYQPSASDVTTGNVTLVLTSTNNCVNTSDTMKINFSPAATANAGTDQTICSSNVINLNGSITIATVGHWSTIGTGTFTPNDSTLNATYTPAFSDNDTLKFILTTNSVGSCGPVTDTMVVYRNGQPTALFSVNNSCIGQTVNFTDNSTTSGGTINSWYWNFGNGDTSTTQNPAYTYTLSGTYSVSLVVSTGTSCKDSITKTVNIHPSPVASFTFTANCMSDSVKFINNSTITSGTINSWAWNFGDGHNSGLQNPHHLYDSSATYTVTLTVVSDSGCSASITHTVTIHPSPLAGFIAQSNCVTLLVNFTDTTKVLLPDTISSYNWTFGDGGTSVIANPSHTYTTTGTYTVLLQVQTNNGCIDTATKVITSGQPVLAQYIPSGGSYNINQSIDFTNQSTGASTYIWNFGDNSTTSTVTDPTHSYNVPGTYTVTLISVNSLGCSDTTKHEFKINPGGYNVPTGFSPNGDGLNDYFYVMGSFTQYELRVFNEWGNQIFMSNTQSDKWDGSFNGYVQPAGTYIYVFNGKQIDGQSLNLKGQINVIR